MDLLTYLWLINIIFGSLMALSVNSWPYRFILDILFGSRFMAHGSWLKAHGSWLMAHGSWPRGAGHVSGPGGRPGGAPGMALDLGAWGRSRGLAGPTRLGHEP